MVDYGDFVVKDVPVGTVAVNPFLKDRLIVVVERQAACIVSARSLEAAGLDFEHVVFAVTVASALRRSAPSRPARRCVGDRDRADA
jgi:hypothetical protein